MIGSKGLTTLGKLDKKLSKIQRDIITAILKPAPPTLLPLILYIYRVMISTQIIVSMK